MMKAAGAMGHTLMFTISSEGGGAMVGMCTHLGTQSPACTMRRMLLPKCLPIKSLKTMSPTKGPAGHDSIMERSSRYEHWPGSMREWHGGMMPEADLQHSPHIIALEIRGPSGSHVSNCNLPHACASIWGLASRTLSICMSACIACTCQAVGATAC